MEHLVLHKSAKFGRNQPVINETLAKKPVVSRTLRLDAVRQGALYRVRARNFGPLSCILILTEVHDQLNVYAHNVRECKAQNIFLLLI